MKRPAVEIIELKNGRRVRCVYDRTDGRWLLTLEPESTGKRGRPRQSSAFVTCQLLLSLRKQGMKYTAAIVRAAQLRGITTRTVIRHWNEHKAKLAPIIGR